MRTVEFWGKKWNEKKQRYETGTVRFKICKNGRKKTGGKCPRASASPTAQSAAIGTCKAVKGSSKVKLCKVKQSKKAPTGWTFRKKRS